MGNGSDIRMVIGCSLGSHCGGGLGSSSGFLIGDGFGDQMEICFLGELANS